MVLTGCHERGKCVILEIVYERDLSMDAPVVLLVLQDIGRCTLRSNDGYRESNGSDVNHGCERVLISIDGWQARTERKEGTLFNNVSVPEK